MNMFGYVGDEVACVAAVSEAIATKALSLIDVEYEILEPYLILKKQSIDPSFTLKKELKKCFQLAFFQRKRKTITTHHGRMEVNNEDSQKM